MPPSVETAAQALGAVEQQVVHHLEQVQQPLYRKKFQVVELQAEGSGLVAL